jgi:dUTP pyrophosphatase
MLKIKIKRLKKEAVIPKSALEGDAGMDVVAITKKETEKEIEYGTGLSFEIPQNYVCLIFPRSSVSNKDLILSNCVGVLDSGYRGELKLKFKKVGKESYNIGDKIGQIMIIPFPKIIFEEVKGLSDSVRGKRGFGSTGN